MNIYNLRVWLKSNFLAPRDFYTHGKEQNIPRNSTMCPSSIVLWTSPTPNKRKSPSLYFYSLFPTLIVYYLYSKHT